MADLVFHRLRISRCRWHYRLLRTFLSRDPQHKSLCRYFWSVVGTLALYAIFVVLLTVLVVAGVAWTLQHPLPVVAGVTVVALTVLIIWGVVTFVRWKRRQPARARPPKAPNLTLEYIRAKKSRICPLIEWTD